MGGGSLSIVKAYNTKITTIDLRVAVPLFPAFGALASAALARAPSQPLASGSDNATSLPHHRDIEM
jgi:hypothetical protein